MSGKHAKNESTIEIEFAAAQKGIEFDQQFAESYERAEEKREAGIYPYDLDKK